MIYFCCDKRRRVDAQRSALNGIDYLEVLDHEAPPGSPRQRTLLVRCFKPVTSLRAANVRLEGGERIRGLEVIWAAPASQFAPRRRAPAGVLPEERRLFAALPQPERVLVVRTNASGDFSAYRLAIQKSETEPEPPDDFDLHFAALDFSFKVECPSDFDCRTQRVCPRAPLPQPDLDYLAKDYASFRQLMLDRLSTLVPQWRERNPADLGVALAELFAYVGDHLSWQQDAVATEAYLGTARRRVSVRRHARLVDYTLHDGCNARVWVQVQVDVATGLTLPAGTRLFTTLTALPRRIAPDSADHDRALSQQPIVFETMRAATFFQAHNEMSFYTWGDRACCLPQGATQATLLGHFPNLRAGDALIFEEAASPRTGLANDAERSRRHAVRLVGVQAFDENSQPLTDPLYSATTPKLITHIRWAEDDALPFPFCLSGTTDEEHGSEFKENVTVARGNLVLADHGLTIENEKLGVVPKPALRRAALAQAGPCEQIAPVPVPARFHPTVPQRPLTQAAPWPSAPASAAALVRQAAREARPSITLTGRLRGDEAGWVPMRDLLNSRDEDRHFVVEIESDGTASLRFGDDEHGQRPEPGTEFVARYRVGNGAEGNVGADCITHIVCVDPGVIAVRNPLPAVGGTEPESIEEARQSAPSAFRVQERAVTEADYAEMAQRPRTHERVDVQRAAATFRWTGSWHTAFVTVDRLGGLPVGAAFEDEMRRHLELFRLAGHDLEIDSPRLVSLEIEMHVCARPGYFRSQVREALLEVFSNRIRLDGQRGVFHPDNFTFGQTVYLSPLYAAAQAVPGVASVRITKFQRQGVPARKPLDDGKLELAPLEIARLDNDPNFPEHGVLNLTMGGGK